VAVRIPVRNAGEKLIHYALFSCALVSVCITFSIVLSVLVESLHFFKQVNWSPQATNDGDKNLSDAFGAIPLFTGTFLIMAIAIGIAAPVGLLCAIYLAEYANPTFRNFAKPILEILAGIPTVVYGYFAIITVSPLLRQAGESIGLSIASESALAAGFVMGIMIIPFISSLADDIIVAVPRALRDASYGLGATQSETIKHVVLPAAIPGIMGALLLAISRAVGETMIVVMAAGLSANLTFNPLNAVTTVTAQIVALLGGDQEFDSAKTLAAFALGLTLFVATLILNIIALIIVKKYREQYE